MFFLRVEGLPPCSGSKPARRKDTCAVPHLPAKLELCVPAPDETVQEKWQVLAQEGWPDWIWSGRQQLKQIYKDKFRKALSDIATLGTQRTASKGSKGSKASTEDSTKAAK